MKVNMPWKAIDGPMAEPHLFEARFDSRCQGCGEPIPTGERIWGVKTAIKNGWIVWHDRPACAQALRDKGFLKDGGIAVPLKPRGLSQRELELLKLFEDEPR